MSITPEALEPEFSLTTAATRLDFLSRRDSGGSALNTVHDNDEDHWNALKGHDTSLDTYEALELLALGEVIARKAHDSQLIGMRAALRGGAEVAVILFLLVQRHVKRGGCQNVLADPARRERQAVVVVEGYHARGVLGDVQAHQLAHLGIGIHLDDKYFWVGGHEILDGLA